MYTESPLLLFAEPTMLMMLLYSFVLHIWAMDGKMIAPDWLDKIQNHEFSMYNTLFIESSKLGEVCLWKFLKSKTNRDIKKFKSILFKHPAFKLQF